MGGVRTAEPEHECIWSQHQGLGRKAWAVICMHQRHHPHVEFKSAHKTRSTSSLCPWFNSSFPMAQPPLECTGAKSVPLWMQTKPDVYFNSWHQSSQTLQLVWFLGNKWLDVFKSYNILILVGCSLIWQPNLTSIYHTHQRIISMIAAELILMWCFEYHNSWRGCDQW